jgi:hypothetical protein
MVIRELVVRRKTRKGILPETGLPEKKMARHMAPE